ncbi:MAG TPA: hypothetical protein VKB80_27505 [Kofleriaceae bacterium]|nr:hypothetical protein [Kofleriaceae bacterium]
MQSITPCLRTISDRFPVASFVVRVPPTRTFEIACATDPSLLRADSRHRRTRENFYTSRTGGLLRAPAGQATVLLPSDQLRRFAGRTRLYYVLGTYGPRGDAPEFSAPFARPELIPSVGIAAGFTGRSLDRSRMTRPPADGRYGAARPVLSWGGDLVGAPAADAPDAAPPPGGGYDDGYAPDLWSSEAAGAPDAREPRDPIDPPDPPDPAWSDDGFMDEGETYGGAGSHELYGRPRGPGRAAAPRGFEDAPALRRAGGTARPAMPAAPRVGPAPAPAPRFTSAAAEAPRGHDTPYPVAAYGGRLDEPPGVEDAPHLARSGRRPSQSPPAPAAMRYGAPAARPARRFPLPTIPRPRPAPSRHTQQRYGQRTAVRPRALEDAPPPPAPAIGVDDLYEDADPGAGALTIPAQLAAAGEPLTIRRKLELVVPIADLVSGADRYAAVAGDVEFDDPTHPAYQRTHHGLHLGLLGVTQRSGLIGKILLACQRRGADLFRQVFGPESDRLVEVTTAPSPEDRLQPVEAAFLWQPPWLDRFRRAGQEAAFQAAQNEVVVEELVDAQLAFAAHLGLTTDRALAMLVDRCAHMGVGGGRRWTASALSPIGEDAGRLAQALAALGAADLPAFQARAGLPADGWLTAETHAALLGGLRALGASSPFPVPATPALLDALVAAAQGRRFAARASWLRRAPAYRDAAVQIG